MVILKKIFFKSIPVLFLFGCSHNHKSEIDILDHVDPMIGTGYHGHTFPGPSYPHGQIQLSPDTHLKGWHASSGYHYADSTLYGFSHNHLSGTGIGDLGDVLVLPFTGEIIDTKPVGILNHQKEISKVGYYSVEVEPWNILAELTCSKRTGIHRYTYPTNKNAKIMVDLAHILQPDWGHQLIEANIEYIDSFTVKGYRKTKGWAINDPIWFTMKFDKPILKKKFIVDNKTINSEFGVGKHILSYFDFGPLDSSLHIEVSISGSSANGAQINMLSSLSKNFDEVKLMNRDVWKSNLEQIKIKTRDSTVLKNFYTALYHTKLAPTLFSDDDGSYRGMDQHIRKGENVRFSAYSLWDTFRSWFPLMTIIEPELSKLWVYDILEMGKEGGLLPKWPLNGNYTGTMVGYPAVAVFSDAFSKNMIDSKYNDFLDLSIKSSTWQEDFYEKNVGKRSQNVMPKHIYFKDKFDFIPQELIRESVSYGLEMSYYDWCISQIAKNLNRSEVHKEYLEKSTFYKLYFDSEQKFMRGKNSNGDWAKDFDPFYSDHIYGPFVEGNSWQWTPSVMHDIEGLRDLMGGEKEFGDWLDKLFSVSSEVKGENASMDISGLIGQYAHGNEPSHHIPFLYQYTDRPWKTQEVIHEILYEFYKPTPDGIIGNEDCGQMSAWYILNAIGLYQITPGKTKFTIGRPIVDSAEIKINDGYFIIDVKNNSKQNKYLESAHLNGNKLDKFEIDFFDIKNGNVLEIKMTDKPNESLQF